MFPKYVFGNIQLHGLGLSLQKNSMILSGKSFAYHGQESHQSD